MKLLLLIVCVLIVAIIVGMFASASSGVVVLSFGDWTLQTSTNFFILLLCFAFAALYLFIRLLVRLHRMPKQYRDYRDKKDLIRADHYLASGMLAMIEGDWQQAEKAFNKGSRFSRAPQLNYIGAAQAAHRLGDNERRDELFNQAYASAETDSAATGIAQAKLLLEQNQTAHALAILNDLTRRFPQQPEVKSLLLQINTQLQDWPVVIDLLAELKKLKHFDKDKNRTLQLQAYAGLLQQAGNSGDDRNLARTWISVPKALRKEVFLIQAYVMQRIRFPDHFDAEIQVRNVLKRQWDETLVRLYGYVRGHDPVMQLNFAEDLLQKRARDPVLLMTLGRLCIQNQLWGKARMYFEECLAVKPSAELYNELARLLEQHGEAKTAATYYQKGLQLATDTDRFTRLPDPGQKRDH